MTTDNEKKCKSNIQLAVEVQLNKLNKGRNFIIIKSSIISQYNIINLMDHVLGLQYIEQLICDLTYENHEELFNQVTWIENLEYIINEIASQIQVNIY